MLAYVTMRQFLVFLLALGTSAALLACAPPAADTRSSVIVISIDTLRADHVGLYGYERDTTPFLDRFAKDCVVFEQAFTPWPWTEFTCPNSLREVEPTSAVLIDEED